jgi:prephenate dehydrogenase
LSTSSGRRPAEPPFDRVALVGLGVLGGSLARALSGLTEGARPTLVGWSPDPAERAAALDAGALDAAPDRRDDACAGADLVVLAAPLGACVELLPVVAAEVGPDATLTDVASLKAALARAAGDAGLEGRWVGCHPMAGSTESGFGASRADLFRGTTVWTVAAPAAADRATRVARLWASVGARTVPVAAEAHDRMMRYVSHTTQLVANAIAMALEKAGIEPSGLGPGGRDMTRLAASAPTMWRDLLADEPAESAAALRAVGATIAELAERLEAGDVEGVAERMRATATWRTR